jgi:hypothetical protein
MNRMVAVLIAIVCVGGAIQPAYADQAAGNAFTYSVANTVPCGLIGAACYLGDVTASTACSAPFPSGSYLDVVTEAAPTPPSGHQTLLSFFAAPVTDWDLFVCAFDSGGGHNGTQLAAGAHAPGDQCDNVLSPSNAVPVGCTEEADAIVQGGTQYVLRAFNKLDQSDLRAIYHWVTV